MLNLRENEKETKMHTQTHTHLDIRIHNLRKKHLDTHKNIKRETH